MAVKTINLTGTETAVIGLDGSHAAIRNDGEDTIYAAKQPGITPGADGVMSVPAGGSAVLRGISGTVYLSGTGSVQMITSDYGDNPFRSAAQNGSGADDQARAEIDAHVGNSDIHVTAAEKTAWSNKPDLSDIPTSLPANGGNADTVEGKHAADFSAAGHTHDDRYYTETEVNNLLAGKAASSHTHTASQVSGLPASLPANGGNADTVDGKHAADFSAAGHTHDDRYYTEAEVNNLLAGKAASSHTHDDRYYTESEINTKLSGKANSSHTHTAAQISGLPTSLPANGGNADTVDGAHVITTAALGLHRLASGTAAATTANCPAGCWYGQH